MNLRTNYLGLKLRSPLVPSASPLSQELDNIRRFEDEGAGAIVLNSLFEEQLRAETLDPPPPPPPPTESFAESLTYLPDLREFQLGPQRYLEHIRRAKEAVDIPIIASLNCASLGGWTDYARQVQQAGADALECNIYFIPAEMDRSGSDVENTYFEILHAVKSAVTIPVALKLSPYFSSMANMAKRLDQAGANGMVLFNRFYQPDVDLETLEITPSVLLSTPQAMRLPLTWIGILYGRVKASLAATSGVHSAEDVLKLLMVGADVTMLCSVLLKEGIGRLGVIERGVRGWMEEHEYESVEQMQGSMSQLRCADPASFERAQYMRAVKSTKHVLADSHVAWSILTGER